MTRIQSFATALACSGALAACSAPTVPGAPTDVAVVFGDGSVTVTWKAPASDGESPITGYTVVTTPGDKKTTVDAATLTATVLGLTNGQAYAFQVLASNEIGDGPLSRAATPVEPATVPGAAAITGVTAGDAQVTVAWAPPDSDGGRAVSGYVVTSTPGGATVEAPGFATTAVVTGLTNGTAYTFVVVATNEVGESVASAPSEEVIPATVPGAVSEVTAERGNASATVTWQAPASDGGHPVSGYRVVSTPDATTVSVDAETHSATVSDLANGVAYVFDVVAVNDMGDSPPSTSNAVTPATIPGAPANAAAVSGDARATVSWAAPDDNGGSAIIHYTVTVTPGDRTLTTEEPSLVVGDLALGTAYVFAITAVNDVGAGPVANTPEVVPATVPAAPASVDVIAGDRAASVSWPAAEGNGRAVTGYVVTSTPEGFGAEVAGDTLEVSLDGLTNGTDYVFHVAAVNAVGQGPAISSATARPLGPPSAATSSLVASVPSASADGTTPIALTFVVRDAEGNPIPNAPVVFSSSDADDSLSVTESITDASGTAITEVTSTERGARTFAASTNAASVQLTVDAGFLVPVCEGRPVMGHAGVVLPTFLTPNQAVTGDLDGDGRPEVVVLSDGSSGIEVIRGASANATGNHERYALGESDAGPVVIGDLNGDARGDVVVGLDAHEVAVFDGLEDGTLAKMRRLDVPTYPGALAMVTVPGLAGDVLLVAHTNTVFAMVPDGAGGYTETSYTTGSSVIELHSTDINGDAKTDVVAACASTPPVVLFGAGDGSFAAPVNLVEEGARDLAFGDFDADGDLDLAWLDAPSVLNTSLNNGDATFAAPSSLDLSESLQRVISFRGAGDDRWDLAVASATGVFRLEAGAGGTFAADPDPMRQGRGVLIALPRTHGSREQAVLMAPADGTQFNDVSPGATPILSLLTRYSESGDSTSAVAAGDVTGDGFPDIVHASSSSSTLRVSSGDGAGDFLSEAVYTSTGTSFSLTLVDMNMDQRLDVVVANVVEAGSTVGVWISQEDGTLTKFADTPTACSAPYAIQAADMNGDAMPDVVVGCAGDPSTNYAGSGVSVMLNDGTGELSSLPAVAAAKANAGLVISDFDEDGHLDVAATALASNLVVILSGDGEGGLSPKNVLFTGEGPFGIASSDLNADGHTDLVVAQALEHEVTVFHGSGDGRFLERESVAVPGPSRVLTVDLDRDGFLDVVVGSLERTNVSVWKGAPDESMGDVVTYGTWSNGLGGVSLLATGDVNLDGLVDVVMSPIAGIAFQPACE